ncbi:hypothetical protein EV06_0863 [Prochlorococcus sp. MIT 0602]|nr:hypothetical protein EV06_0863 [Prochlorococcus sp. MIT 0602]
MENLAKKNGSGIEIDSLLGHWQFVSVWKQNADKEDKLSSSLLRLFSASLDLRKLTSDKDFPTLSLSNTIEFGPLLIRFLGLGGIRGKQPLLPFFFERIELKLGKLVLINRLLNEPDEKDMPFFSLIAKSNKDGWLVARGRGGGIALWLMSNK